MARDVFPTPTELEILLALLDGQRHGYGIKLAVEERTEGRLKLGSGTLYEALQRLERGGMIREAEAPPAQGQRAAKRRFYQLTDEGFGRLEREIARLESTVRFARAHPRLAEGA